jgi:acetyl esterase/lipase
MRPLSAALATLLVLLAAPRLDTAARPSEPALLSGEEILLWPADAPGSEALSLQETITERSQDPSRHDRIFTGVLKPSLRVHRPARPNGAAMIVAPGGAYQRIVIDKEGRDIADWLGSLGVTAFVLKYRLPGEGHASPADVPLQDAQRAIRVLRARAKELGIDPARLGIIGFSAGAHLAGALATYYDRHVSEPVDSADELSARPDLVVLAYPVVGPDHVRQEALDTYPGLREVISRYPLDAGASADWPPTFILHAADDSTVSAEGSLRLFRELRSHGVPAEIHVFQSGGHGFGIQHAEGPIARWPVLCGKWMGSLGVLGER